MKTIPVVGRCACPAAHTRRQGVSGVLLALSILCVGLADAEEACTLSACVHPDGAGSVIIAPVGDLGTGGYAMVEAVDMPPDSIFYKWTYSEGAELLDAGSQSTMVRRAEGSAATNIEVVAHFLVLHADTGTVSVRSSYKGNISGLSLIRKNRAGVKAALQAEMAGMALDKDTFVQLNAGDVSAGHVLSEDPKLKNRGASGAASFDQFSPGAAKPCGSLSLTWNAKGIQVAYMLKPPAEQNLISVYADIYKKNNGKTFSIDSEDTGDIPLSIVMEGADWCSVWVAKGGVAYAGRARSKLLKKIEDDIVSWRVSGTDEFARYTWHAPAAAQANRQGHAVNGGRIARAAMTAAPHGPAAAQKSFTIAESQPENVTRYPIWTSPSFDAYGPKSIQAPFYFGGHVYALSIPTKVNNKVVLTDGVIDGSGAMQIAKTIGVTVGEPGVAQIGSANRLTTCVFKGKVYLFFDVPNVATEFKIYGCRSSKPEIEWENIGILPVTGAHTYEDGLMHTGLKAVVFGGRIYLIVGTGDGAFTIHSSPDGEKWQLVARLNDAASWGDKYRSEMNACVVTRNAQPMLCIAVLGTDHRPQWMYLRYFDMQNRMAGGNHYYLDWVSSAHGIGIANGTVRGSTAGQVVQIFTHSSSWELYTHVRACTIDVESGAFQGWWNVPLKVQRPRLMYCDAVESAIPVPQQTNNIRKCISFFTEFEYGQVGIPVYQSDLIKRDGEVTSVDTSSGAFRDPESWTLIGVIHGCPPFTRNGNNSENSMSKVAYTRGNDQSSTHDFSFENEVYLKLAGIASIKAPTAEEELGFDAEIGAAFKNTTSIGWGYTESFKSRGTETFYSMTTNKDGKYGQLVYAQPTIDTQPYCVYSQDGSVRLLSYNTVNVGMLNIGYETFDLANPPKGMVALKPTSDLPYWKNDRPEFISYSPQVHKLLSKQLLPSQFSDSGGSFVRTWEGYFEVGNKSTLSVIVNAKAVLFLGLKMESREELSFDFKYSQKESWSEELSFNIGVIPAPPAGSTVNIQGMAVDANCYMPLPGIDLRKIARPEWLPDSRVGKQFQVPWLMTWKVKGTE